jgi:hypothetical protein
MTGSDIFAPRNEGQRRTWSLATVPLTLAFLTVGTLAAVLLWNVSGFGQPLSLDEMVEMKNVPPLALAFQIGAGFALSLIPLFLWIRFFERGSLAAIGLHKNPVVPFIAGYFGGLASLTIVVCAIAVMGGYKVEAAGTWAAPTMAALFPLAAYALAFVLQGSTEEIFTRGWMMQIVSSRYGATAGIIFTSLFFSFMHGSNITPGPELIAALANIALVGVFLAIWAVNQGHLWGVCGWHASWNWLVSTGFGLEVSGQSLNVGALVVDLTAVEGTPWWITGGRFGPEASIVTTLFLIAACIWAAARIRRAG